MAPLRALRVPSTAESLGLIRDFVGAAAAEAGLGRRRAYRLTLAVDEVATNIVTYGYGRQEPRGELAVLCSLTEETLTIFLEDTGPPFDPREQPGPDFDSPLEERTAGGLGIYLATHSVDAFAYERDGERNRNVFIRYRIAE